MAFDDVDCADCCWSSDSDPFLARYFLSLAFTGCNALVDLITDSRASFSQGIIITGGVDGAAFGKMLTSCILLLELATCGFLFDVVRDSDANATWLVVTGVSSFLELDLEMINFDSFRLSRLSSNGKTCGVCKVSSPVPISSMAGNFVSGALSIEPELFSSTARRNVSSKGFTCCRSSKSPTSSHLTISRVGVGVWSANKFDLLGNSRFSSISCFFR